MHQTVYKLIFDFAGWFGALLFLISYLMLIIKKWSATSLVFHLYNLFGGVLIFLSAFYDHSYPAAYINLAWAFIAAYGVFSDHVKKR
jgi:hypothetical protein